MQKTLLLSLAWSGRCLVIALHTHVTNKSGVTHDIFSIIAIHSALLGPQAPQTKFEYVRDGIRTSNKAGADPGFFLGGGAPLTD